ncbi:MAG: carboxymuconolactone decarboxylase family protein [Phycisphaerae bacterium]|nr:carboxymuconolactone decarboxylase family protein [Phycisphaerae bacterium]
MSEDVKKWFSDYDALMPRVKELAPNAINGFAGLFGKVMAAGTVSVLEKELIAIGIATAIQCEPCIRLHVKKCLEAGATPEQVMEAVSVAVMMAGGPAFTHLGMVVETLDALKK